MKSTGTFTQRRMETCLYETDFFILIHFSHVHSACLESGTGHDGRYPRHHSRSDRRGSTRGEGGSQEPGHEFHAEAGEGSRRPGRLIAKAAGARTGDRIRTRSPAAA